MTIKNLKDINKMGFLIEEVINNVTESSTVNLDKPTTLEDIANFNHTTKDSYYNYEASFTRYQVIKDGTVITDLLETQGLIDFFETAEYLQHFSDDKEK